MNYNETVIEKLRNEPHYTEHYFREALCGLDDECGERDFLIAIRHIIEAKGGMRNIAQLSGLSRENLYRAFSENGNPTLRTIKQVIHALGLKFSAIGELASSKSTKIK